MNSRKRLNWTLATGLITGLFIVGLAVFHSTSTPWIFMNFVGFLIVVGGMVAAAMIMYPFNDLKAIVNSVVACLFSAHSDSIQAIQEIVRVNQLQSQDPLFFNREFDWVSHMLLRDGVELLSLGLRPEEIQRRMELIAERGLDRRLKHSGALLTLAKLGPGFGLLGTLLGLVVMLQDMGANGDFEKVGPALAISLLATLYGVISANLVLQPLSELVRNRAEDARRIDQLIIDGTVMLKNKRHSIEIRDALRAHLNWEENSRLNEDLAQTLKPAQTGAKTDQSKDQDTNPSANKSDDAEAA